MAQALVKRAARECHGLPTLYARLAEQVSDPAARQALVQQMAHLRASSGSAAGRAAGAGAGSERAPKPLATPTGGPAVASLAGRSPAARYGSSAAAHAHATSGSGRAAPLSPALLDGDQHLLALHLLALQLGPIAKVRVRKAAEAQPQREGFIQRLATHLTSRWRASGCWSP